jgi:hypothetical protein
VVPLEWPYQVREPANGDPSNLGTSERFAEYAHKDERWEGGVIRAEPVGTSTQARDRGGKGKEDHNNLYYRDFMSLLKRAELWSEEKDQRFTFHSLRHTCATLLLSRNVNQKIVQEMLGRATITQTMDTYSHELPGMEDVAGSALEKALSRPACLVDAALDSNREKPDLYGVAPGRRRKIDGQITTIAVLPTH